jgi:hypothetical protein
MRRRLPWLVTGAGVVLVVAGVVVLVVAHTSQSPVAFGWSAYVPPSEVGAYASEMTLRLTSRWTVFRSDSDLVGAGLVVLGVLTLTVMGGWLLGRRSGARL